MKSALAFDEYPRPSLAVDPAVLTVDSGKLLVALWRRLFPPQKGTLALPGVFVNEGEDLESSVLRGLREKAGVSRLKHLEQLFTWNKTGRDPRGWVVSVAYFGLAPASELSEAVQSPERADLFELVIPPGSVAGRLRVLSRDGSEMKLAFDHAEILTLVVMRLREKLWTSDVALALLPDKFTLRELQSVYEAVLSRSTNKDSFRRRVTKTLEIVRPTGEFQDEVDHRPAELYTRASRRTRRAVPARG